MPAYQYTVKTSSSNISGVIEATDPSAACLVAYVDSIVDNPEPWTGDPYSYMDLNHVLDEKILETYLSQIKLNGSNLDSMSFLKDDGVLTVTVKPYGCCSGQTVVLSVTLRVLQTDDKLRTADSIKEYCENLVRAVLKTGLTEDRDGLSVAVGAVVVS